MTLHTASKHSAIKFFIFSLANSVEWHVAEGNQVGHVKHIVTVRRKACPSKRALYFQPLS
jgi:hypothetical protein